MSKMLLISLILATMVAMPYTATAQEEDVEYGGGTVVGIDKASGKITVTEYDWESDAEGTVIYIVDEGAEFENVTAIAEISPDDYVEVEYIIDKDGKRIAKYITVYSEEEPQE